MPDISMCVNNKCERRKSCYRYMAIPDEYCQSYIDFKCTSGNDDFMKIYRDDKLTTKE